MKKILLIFAFVILFTAFIYYKKTNQTASVNILSPKTPAEHPPANIVYKNGEYEGVLADAYWGKIQVIAVVENGKLVDVQILDYPADRLTSDRINGEALPTLIAEAIQVQHAEVDVVSGATDSSKGFQDSLRSALTQAKL